MLLRTNMSIAPKKFVPHWNWSRANFLSKAGQNSNIYKGLSKAGQNSNSQTRNHTSLQEYAHTPVLALHCSDESQFLL